MFDPHISAPQKTMFDGGNWEKDVRSVVLEACDKGDDPTGLCVIFLVGDERPLSQRVNSYRVGASYLRKRLEGIRRAGFEAPMTVRAIEMVEKSRQEPKAKTG